MMTTTKLANSVAPLRQKPKKKKLFSPPGYSKGPDGKMIRNKALKKTGKN